MNSAVSFVTNLLPTFTAYAHCDIPCGIYDPHTAQLAAHTVIRMTQLINELKVSSENPPFEERKTIIHQISRYTHVKEEHAELLKREVQIIWGDYFKEDHLKDYPKLHDLVFKIMKHASKVKQEIVMEEAQELLKMVQEFAEIFWKTKNRETVRVASGYPTAGEMVLPASTRGVQRGEPK